MNLQAKIDADIAEYKENIRKRREIPLEELEEICDTIEAVCREDTDYDMYAWFLHNGIRISPYISTKETITKVLKAANKLGWFVTSRNEGEDSISYSLYKKENIAFDVPLVEGQAYHRCKNHNGLLVSISFEFLSTGTCKKVQVGVKEVPVYAIRCESEEI